MAIDKNEALRLLNIDNKSKEFYELIKLANNYARKMYNNKGFVFGQVGLNAEPCSIDCKFCAFGKSHYSVGITYRKNKEEIASGIKDFLAKGCNDIFLMTTADYPIDQFIEYGEFARKIVPDNIRLVANIGDFNLTIAKKLKDVGFTGCYHICRLNEGLDTKAKVETRKKTLDAIRDAGLELYYCVEPIGPEHAYEQMVEEMFRAKDYSVNVMAAMRRVPVLGTPLYEKGTISSLELAKIVAVALLVVKPTRAMGVHEPNQLCLLAGANQIYAEVGANPRDIEGDTEKNRGFDTNCAWEMLTDAEWVK